MFIKSIYQESFKPEKKQPIYEWARSNVKMDPSSPIPGYYRIENSLMFKEPLEAWQNESIRNILTIGPNQGGRTKAMEVASVWTMVHRPGPSQWNTDTNIKAKDFAEERWWKTAESVAGLRNILPKNSDDKRKCKVMFRNGMPFVIQGANESNAEQKSVMNQFNDELFQWGEGMIDVFHKRCDMSYAATHKIWDGSIPSDEGTELYHHWGDSSRGEWSFCCRKCAKVQAFKWKQVKWDTSEITKPNGIWNTSEVRKTVHYKCEACPEMYDDSSASRKQMNESGRYVHENPNAEVKGFRYNALAINFPMATWGSRVVEFLRAMDHFKQYGSTELLRSFWTRRMCEFFEEAKHIGKNTVKLVSDYKIGDPNEYQHTRWEGDDGIRVMASDRQEDVFPYVIRGVRKDGDSRAYCMGYAKTEAELEMIRKAFDVKPWYVVMDIGFERQESLAACVTYGWTGMRGDQANSYRHRVETSDQNGNKLVRYIDRPYSEKKWADPGFSAAKQKEMRHNRQIIRTKRAVFYEFSNLSIKNMLASLRSGRARVYWGTPEDPRTFTGDDISKDYRDQLDSETRYRSVDRKGRATYFWSNCGRDGKGTKKANHFYDCEVMILVVMAIQQLIEIRAVNSTTEEDVTEPEETKQEAA